VITSDGSGQIGRLVLLQLNQQFNSGCVWERQQEIAAGNCDANRPSQGYLYTAGTQCVSAVAFSEDEYQSYSGIRSKQQTAPSFVTGHDFSRAEKI
jgi:hypothetical protein